MSFIDPDSEDLQNSTGFIDPDAVSKPKKISDNVAGLYGKYSAEFDKTADAPQIPTEADPLGKRKPKKLTPEEFQARTNATILDNLAGLVEGPLSIATKLPASLLAGPAAAYGAMRGLRGKELEQAVAEITSGPKWTDPRTERGQKIVQGFGELMQPFGLSPYANIGAAGARASALGRPKILDVDVGQAIKDKIASTQNVDKPAATIPETIQPPAATDAGAAAMQNIVEQQLRDWVEPLPPQPRSAMPDIVQQLEQERFSRAQQELEARQAAMEQEMAQRATLERQAAERARMEQQPTGYAEWQEAQRQAANQRIPGDNTPLSFESPYPVDASQYPNVLADAPYRYEGGIDMDVAGEKGLPIAVRDALGPLSEADPFNRYSPMQQARRILIEGEEANVIKSGREGLTSGPIGKQRGAIDMRVFEEGFNDIKELANGLRILARGENGELKIVVVDQNNNEKGHLTLTPDSWANPTPESNARASWVDSSIPGLAKEMYRYAAELGNDIVPSKVRTVEGREMWDRFNKSGFANNDMISRATSDAGDFFKNMPLSGRSGGERGVINFNNLGEKYKRLAVIDRNDPSVMAASKRAVVKDILGNIDGYRANITTPEQVIALAPKSKDITKLQKFNTNWRPGLRINTINTNNPLLKFANHVIHNAWTQADNLARTWITDNKTGIGPMWRKLKNNEKIEVHELLQAGDRKQRKFTADELRANNFTEAQIAFIQKFYEMDDLKYQVWNESRMEVGLDPVRYREGHFPGNFTGDYKTLVLDKEGKIIGYIGTDTKLGHNRALEAVKKQFPDATFSRMTRSKLGGHGNRSDLFTGMSDLIAVLAKNDPRIAEIQQAVQHAITQQSDGNFNANLHALDKKGIWGNEGNKPWQKDSLEAANDAMKAFFEYWEEGMISHKLLPAEAQLKSVMQNPALDGMPRAKEYLNEYVKGITGRSVGDVGMALNTLLDLPGRALGLGPSVTREAVNQFTKRMGQWTQGFANIPYTLMQFTQYAQTGVPLFTKVAGGDMLKQSSAISKAGADAVTLLREKLLGQASTDPVQRAMFDYAEQKGMFQFSEFEEVSQVSQGEFARQFDKVVDFNRTLGEVSTRPATFFTFMRLLEDQDIPLQEKLDTAYNLTQDAMVDYSGRERAPMFKNLGVLGQTAGNLQQFSLTYLDQMGRWIKDARKGNLGPLVTGMTILLVMAGLQGAPFYNTIDDLVEQITDKFFGEKKNIATMVMESPYEWLKSDWLQYGILSTSSGLNITGRLGMADVAPESFVDALSPYASSVGRMATTAYDAFKNPDDVSFATAARQWAPSSIRGLIENKYLTDDTGTTINAKGQLDYPRTEFDREARKWAMTSLEEAKAKDKLYTKQKSLQADTERVTKVGERISRRVRLSDNYTQQKFEEDVAEYTARGGDPKQLVNKIIRDYEEAAKTSKMRIEGTTLKNMQQLRRWMKINEE